MDPDRWNRIRSILEALIAADPGGREAILAELCGDDGELRAAVESLLTWGDTDELGTRDTPSQRPTASYAEPETERDAGMRIGGYELIRRIGEGSFGVVYLARQHAPLKRDKVALKILKPTLGSRQILARFDAERLALTLMNHENIARILDAGTAPDGAPYFVMEYVPGVPITEHCDRQRLGIDERLEIFIQVCHAVQHAHQKGIVHRDLKPSNILVAYENDESVPKVIDFGVAKALYRPLSEQLRHTLDGQLIGTLAYMSPEQLERTAQDIDTRSDIYSLGVLLYQLLIDALPFDPQALREAGLEGMVNLIRNVEPARPSTKMSTLSGSDTHSSVEVAQRRRLNPRALSRQLRGDLDWITMRCLEKERSRRFATAKDLADDLKRHLDSEPVLTVPPSFTYKLTKFVKRNRGAVAAGVVLTAVLLAGIVGVTAANVRAIELERQKNVYEAGELVEQARLLSFEDPGRAWDLATEAAGKNPDSPEPQLEMARIRQLQRRTAEALALTREMVERFPDSGDAAAMLAGLLVVDDPAESRRQRQRAERLLVDQAGDRKRSANEARSRLLFNLAVGTADVDRSLELLDESIEAYPWNFDAIWQRAWRRFNNGDLDGAGEDATLMTRVHDELSMVWNQYGAVDLERAKTGDDDLKDLRRKQLDAAESAFDRALELDPDYWMGWFNLGQVRKEKGDFEAALADFERAVKLRPGRPETHLELGRARNDLGDDTGALEAFTAAIDNGGDNWEVRANRGSVNQRLGNLEQAETDFTAAIEGIKAAAVLDELVEKLAQRGDTRVKMDDGAGALSDAAEAIDLQESGVDGPADHDPSYPYLVLAKALLLEGHRHAAVKAFDAAVELAKADDVWLNRLERGLAHWKLGDPPRAREDFSAYVDAGQTDADWVRLWVWAIHREAGDASAAAAELAAAASTNDRLLRRVLDAIRGAASPDDVAREVEADGNPLYGGLYLGLAAFVDGRDDEARRRLESAVAQRKVTWLEHDLARWLFSRLEK